MRLAHQLLLVLLFLTLCLWLPVFIGTGFNLLPAAGLSLGFAYLLHGFVQVIVRGKDAAMHAYLLGVLSILVGTAYLALLVLTPTLFDWSVCLLHVFLVVYGLIFMVKTKQANRSYFVSS